MIEIGILGEIEEKLGKLGKLGVFKKKYEEIRKIREIWANLEIEEMGKSGDNWWKFRNLEKIGEMVENG